MGYMLHHAIVVTSYSNELIEKAHWKAKVLGCRVTEITASATNGYRSFLIAPDGSKEGWDESQAGDERREAFVNWAHAQAHDDGSNSLGFVEVAFHGDDYQCEVIHDDGERKRK